MAGEDPFKRLEEGLAQGAPKQPAQPTDAEICESAERDFARLFEAFQKFDAILGRNNDWGVRFTWLNVDQNRMAHGYLAVVKNGLVVHHIPMWFAGRGVWFTDNAFVKVARREEERGNWTVDESDDLIAALSRYLQQIVQQRR